MINRILKAFNKRIKRLPIFRVKKNLNPVRWGIIGLGNMAEKFSTAIDGNKNGIVYAVASRDKKKALMFGKRHNCSHAYGSYQEMLQDDKLKLDVVYISTPVKYHYENIKQCLLSGKNVLCEKPICSTSKQLEELINLAKAKNCFLMEGMWTKCLPSFCKGKEWESLIGKKELIKIDFYKRELICPEQTIFNAAEGGGVLKDYGVYAISFATSFLESLPKKLIAHSRQSSFKIDSDWQIYAENNGVQAFISLSSNFDSLSKASVIGTEGTIEWNSQFNRTNVITLYDNKGKQLDKFVANYEYDGFEYELNEVQKCIKEGKKESTLVPLIESLNTLKVIDLITKSHHE